MILRDIDNLKLTVRDRLLLTLLARIWTGKTDSLGEVGQAVPALDQEQREILADWMEEQHGCEISPSQTSSCPCCPEQFNSSLIPAQKME